MKKLSGIRASDLLMCVMLSISLFLTLGGCSRLKPFMFIDDGDKAEARLTKVIKAIEEKDKTALIAMFSEQALSEAADIKARIDYLFEFVNGDIESWDDRAGSVDTSMRSRNRWETSRYWFTVKTSKDEYIFLLNECTADTVNSENVGLYMIMVIKQADKDKYFSIGYNEPNAGIFWTEEHDLAQN